ncbi:DMT family transporter [Campylobacter geochelonis]|uniref:Uncharacterized protein conserved in bacteria n=1 Tax=Campylobacter geochelonis TaxID=1780362 RepID=A0A128EIJ8_9BACT|nr:DMT family transporter [Campylobacter geochelonis]QKF71572.1 DMT family transporter [Campylobacter geochelonis]CZE48735.1 Uncharacterized protein conserved in bacteria [Campylobacter geochelonis]CZE49129.1 Uncharacterized protein conserved in bacteria [Campylobacter geochelonis]
MKLLFIITAVVAGMMLPLQAVLNSALGASIKQPLFAAFASFLIGTITLFIALLIIKFDFYSIVQTKSAPPIVWLGGVIGAFYVWIVIVATPILGASLTFATLILGQMLISIMLDHYGVFGLPVVEISLSRIAGVLLILFGIFLIKKF